MVDDLLHGRITSFRREQGFGVITLDDGRDVKFDASHCKGVFEEGTAVQLRVGPARWGGGLKALTVEPRGSTTMAIATAPPTLDEQIAALQREHLVASLSEQVMAELSIEVFGGAIADAQLIDVLDAYYTADAARARIDGYLRFAPGHGSPGEVLPVLAMALPGVGLPHPSAVPTADDLVPMVNRALETERDPRRLHALATGGDWRAYYVLAGDRARRLSRILPLA